MNKRIVVTGASGTIGREVVVQLVAMGQPVTVLTREKTIDSFLKEVDVFNGDLSDPTSLGGLFRNVGAAHLIAFGDNDYTPLEVGHELISLLESEQVRRVTVLWNGEGKAGTLEQAVMESRLEWTILQPQEYMANVLPWAPAIRERALVEEPCMDRPTAAIHEKDVAAVISHILVDGGHAGKIYPLTGPDVLTPREQVLEISNALGIALATRELNEAEARQRWRSWGIPEHTIDYLYGWYSDPPPVGYTPSLHVQAITGRPSRPFKEWVQSHLTKFR